MNLSKPNPSTNEPAVTWLLPVHNGEPFLETCLESMANQTYRNVQVLALDDGSTDGTFEILARWIPGRITGRIIRRECKGLGYSLAELVQESPTELCAVMNHDDICAPARLQKQVDYMVANPDVAVLGTFMYLIDEDGRQVATMEADHRVSYAVMNPPTEPADVLHTLLLENPMGHPSVMFRRSAVLAAGNYGAHAAGGFEHHTFFEDYDLWIRMAAKFKLANLAEPLVYYRRRSGSIMERAAGDRLQRDKTNESLRRSVQNTFGIEPETAITLRERRLMFALPSILRIAKALNRTETPARTVAERLRMRSFTSMSRRIIRRLDLITRFVLAYCESGLNGIATEVSALAADARELLQPGSTTNHSKVQK